MAFLEYRIHPSVGIARMGDSPDHYFVGAEEPRIAVSPQIRTFPTSGKTSAPITEANKFRVAGKIAKQAARFRVFAYYWDDYWDWSRDDYPEEVVECTAADFDFEWKVQVANCKQGVNDAAANRPPAVTIKTTDKAHFEEVRFMVEPVTAPTPEKLPLGGVVLDDDPATRGTLLVIGSDGATQLKRPASERNSKRNTWNLQGDAPGLIVDGAADDAADGPVTVTVTPKPEGSAPKWVTENHDTAVYRQAWVVIALPDFGADLAQPVSLYERAIDEGRKNNPAPTRFKADSYYDMGPVLDGYLVMQDSSVYFKKHTRVDFAALNAAPATFKAFLEPADPDSHTVENVFLEKRQESTSKLMPYLWSLKFPKIKHNWVDHWVAAHLRKRSLGELRRPMRIDRAHMDSMCGGSFWPGIEVGREAGLKSTWVASFGAAVGHIDIRVDPSLSPGYLTRSLAVPWQGDYQACGLLGDREFWPSSRPSVSRLDTASAKSDPVNWDFDRVAAAKRSPPKPPGPPGETTIQMNFLTQWTELGFIRRKPPGSAHDYRETERTNL